MSVSAKIEAIQNLHATHNIISTLEQSKASIEQLVDEMPDALFVFDSSGVILKANLEGCRLLKVEPEYYLGANLASVFDHERYNILSSKIQMIAKQPTRYERAHEFELQAMMEREELQPYHWALRPLVPHSYDKVPLIVLYGRNLSEIRNFERELSQIYSNIPIGIISIGASGQIEANYSHYCEYLLQHSHFVGMNNGFAGVGIVDLLYEPAFNSMNSAEIESCKLLHKVVGNSEYWFETIKSNFPKLLRRRIGDNEIWLKVDYHAVTQEGKVHKLLLIIENRSDLIREREERSIWIRRNESGIRRILEIQNSDISLLENLCVDLELLMPSLDYAVESSDIRAFRVGLEKIRVAADKADFLSLKEFAEILDVKISTVVDQEPILDSDVLAKLYAPIRFEIVELVKIFYILNSNSLSDLDYRSKFGPDNLEVSLAAMESYLTDLMAAKASNPPKKVTLSFAWDSVSIPVEIAKPLRKVIAFFVEKSVERGIELPDHRQKIGKSAQGHLKIFAEKNGNDVIFTLSDDGRGISAEKIREIQKKKLVQNHLKLDSMNDEQVVKYMFDSSFLRSNVSKQNETIGFGEIENLFTQLKVFDVEVSSQIDSHTNLHFKLKLKN